MLRRLAKPALNILVRSQARTILCAFKPSFTFATNIENVSKLKNIITDQIKYQEQNKEDLTEFTNFFTNQGWKINYNGIQVQLSKKSGPYNLRVLFNAKTPMGSDLEGEQGQNQGQQQEQAGDQDFTEVVGYIQKDGNSKWLAIDFMVGTSNQAQIASATFINDYQFEKKQRKSGKIPETGYNGPELSTLEDKVQQSLYSFIEGVGLTGEILQRAAQFSLSYEHQFYIEWLKDLKSLA